ncbi:MAG: hypothetical protein U0325_32160 [Polyangiales bacterium]
MRPRRPLIASRAALRALALALATLAVALPSLFGGAAYVWCEGMHRAMVRPCCPETRPDPAHAAIDQPCCDERAVAGMPTVPLPELPLPVAPPLALFVAMTVWLMVMRREAPARPPRRGHRRTRAGPAPPLYQLHCALLN